jgi:hyperosmotically inducible periplasmic protein
LIDQWQVRNKPINFLNERQIMKTQIATACFIVGAVLAPVAVHAEDMDKDRSSPKEFVKDSVITTKIKAEMAKDKTVSATHIKVDTDASGMVQLSGTAKSKAEAEKAVTIAQNVKGVVSVKNNIQVQSN